MSLDFIGGRPPFLPWFYKATVIVTEETWAHRNHDLCLQSLWIETARRLLNDSTSLKEDSSPIDVMTSAQLKASDLYTKDHSKKTVCVLGDYNGNDANDGNESRSRSNSECRRTIQGIEVRVTWDNTIRVLCFPRIIDALMNNQFQVYIGLGLPHELAFGPADAEMHRRTGKLSLLRGLTKHISFPPPPLNCG